MNDSPRPLYHYVPSPALGTTVFGDPNGPIFHNGYYHLFHQGDNHWGHARSRDLVHWEHLPIAFKPDRKIEYTCWSGTTVVNARGEVLAIYTSTAPMRPKPGGGVGWDEREPWSAFKQRAYVSNDPHLIHWKRHAKDPLLDLDSYGGPRVNNFWRDPFVFRAAGRAFLILGASTDKIVTDPERLIPIYEATNSDLSEWTYRGILYSEPQNAPPMNGRFPECPNFFKLDGKWVLLVSAHQVLYRVGSFDIEKLTFTKETEGYVDPFKDFIPPLGPHDDGFYASSIILDEKGRPILVGMVIGPKGSIEGKEWKRCMSLPRELWIDPEGHLRQAFHPALRQLRDKHWPLSELALSDGGHVLKDVEGDALEIQVAFDPGKARSFGLRLRRSADGTNGVEISYGDGELSVAGRKAPFEFKSEDGNCSFHIFLDRGIVEVIADAGRISASLGIVSNPKDLGVEVFARGGSATVESMDVWKLKSIWRDASAAGKGRK